MVVSRASYKMITSQSHPIAHSQLSQLILTSPHLSLIRPVPISYAYTQYNIGSHSYNYNNTITLAIAIIITIIVPQVFHLFVSFIGPCWLQTFKSYQILPPASIYWIPGRLHLTEPLTGLCPVLCFSNFVCSVQLERWPSLNIAAQYHWMVNRKDSNT